MRSETGSIVLAEDLERLQGGEIESSAGEDSPARARKGIETKSSRCNQDSKQYRSVLALRKDHIFVSFLENQSRYSGESGKLQQVALWGPFWILRSVLFIGEVRHILNDRADINMGPDDVSWRLEVKAVDEHADSAQPGFPTGSRSSAFQSGKLPSRDRHR